jgi:hypothetical protein
MIHEFAIEPAVLDCWSRYEYFMADCGVEKGRLVAEFPVYHWKKRVWQAVTSNPARTPKDEQKVQYHLQHTADTKLIYLARAFHFQTPEQPWLGQAAREHAKRKFRLIVSCATPTGIADAVLADDFDKHDVAAWQVDTTCSIARTPEAIADLSRLLCAGSKVVKLLDPHFDSGEARFKKSFSKIFETVCQAADSRVRIEVHSGCKQSQEDFTDKLNNDWPPLISPGRRIYFLRWVEEPQGEQLHRRLILSERGGILVEAGLDAGLEGQTTTATLLSATEHARFWKGLVTPGAAGPSPDALYDFTDSYEVTGAADSRRHGHLPRGR